MAQELLETLKEKYASDVIEKKGRKRREAAYEFYTRTAPELVGEKFGVLPEDIMDELDGGRTREKLGLARMDNVFDKPPFRIEIQPGRGLFEALRNYWRGIGSKRPEIDAVFSLKYLAENNFDVEHIPAGQVFFIENGRMRFRGEEFDVHPAVTIELDTRAKLAETERNGRPYEEKF